MKKIITILILCLITSAGFAEFTASDKYKLDSDLKTLNLDKSLSKELTVKDWKKKRKSANLSSEQKTGIADKLQEIATSYKEISGEKVDNFMFPDFYRGLSTEEVTNSIKIARDQWKELSNFQKKLDELKDIADNAEKMFETAKEELEKDAKNKKKITKIQIAINAAKEIANKAEDLSQKIKKVDPKAWRNKFQADKGHAIKYAQGTDKLRQSGVKPEKLAALFQTMNVIFSGALITVCDSFSSEIVPELEKLRDDPVALAKKFNDKYLKTDMGSRKVSQNLTNISLWNSKFAANFLYPTTDITQAMNDFTEWGGGTSRWTPENAVTNLDKYKLHLEDIKKWAEKYGKQWEKDKGN